MTMADARPQIGLSHMGLGGILSQYKLVVPPHQREYFWRTTEVEKLLEDFGKAILDQVPEYFLGAVVTIPRSPNVLDIIDGQQRLATTAIILSEIRNHLTTIKEDLIAESVSRFLTEIDRSLRERVPKLQLNVDDHEFFKSVIIDGEIVEPTKPSHSKIMDAVNCAKKQIAKIVSSLPEKDHGDVLNQWIEFIEHRATVVLLQVPSESNAYKMFETLNNRGIEVSQADLIKNHVFGKSGTRLPEAQQKWALMRGTLETVDEPNIILSFMRHAIMNMDGYVTEDNVYDVVERIAKSSQATIKFLSDLEMLSTYYVAIFNPESEKWNSYPDSMRRAIETLNLLNIKPIRPLMMAVAAKFSAKEATETFSKLISWGVRLFMASTTRSESIIIPLADASTSVFAGDITTYADLKKKLTHIIPNDAQFRQGFEVYTASKTALVRYYMRTLEMAAKGEANPCFIPNDDRQTINLEHILPERPEDKWPQFTEDSHRANVKRLGNMALLVAKTNSDLKSASREEKWPIYADSPYYTTKMIAKYADWTEDTIAERQKTLASFALKAWPI